MGIKEILGSLGLEASGLDGKKKDSLLDRVRSGVDELLPKIQEPISILGNFLKKTTKTISKSLSTVSDALDLNLYNAVNELRGEPQVESPNYTHEDFQALLEGESCPCAVVDMEAFDHNIEMFLKGMKATGKHLRVGTKSVRVPALIERAMKKFDFDGLFLFHPNEIKYWQETRGIQDFIVAYPIINIEEAETCTRGAARDPNAKITLMIDSTAHLHLLEKSAAKQDVNLHVLVDLDVSIDFFGQFAGVMRSPLNSPDKVVRLARKVNRFPHLSFRGIMGYEAQEAGIGDQSLLYRFMKQQSRGRITRRRAKTVQALEEAGLHCEIVNGGGSGCFQDTARETFVTEVTVGSGLFKSYIFDPIESLREFMPSLFMALRIVRTPRPGVVTAYSGGYVSSAINKQPKIVFPRGCTATSREGFGEVQTPITFNPEKVFLKHGDLVICRLAKAGEPLERFNHVVTVKGNSVLDKRLTYRGEGLWLG
ncbi:hypothetical protein GF325_19065 [Candidatus Bathyarchaeota archaeon]|nr:hypothetical protein [Candidatus Bathyarchaeota archaeon]